MFRVQSIQIAAHPYFPSLVELQVLSITTAFTDLQYLQLLILFTVNNANSSTPLYIFQILIIIPIVTSEI